MTGKALAVQTLKRGKDGFCMCRIKWRPGILNADQHAGGTAFGGEADARLVAGELERVVKDTDQQLGDCIF